MKQQHWIVLLAVVLGLILGATGLHFFFTKKLERQTERILEDNRQTRAYLDEALRGTSELRHHTAALDSLNTRFLMRMDSTLRRGSAELRTERLRIRSEREYLRTWRLRQESIFQRYRDLTREAHRYQPLY